MSASVLLVDDQELMRMAFRMVIESQPDLHVAGEAANGLEAVAPVDTLRPDVVLMDVRMPELDGVEATRRIVDSGSATDHHPHDLRPRRVRLCGTARRRQRLPAQGCAAGRLLSAIRAVASGDAVVAPSITRRLLDAYAHRRGRRATGPEDRSTRQRERLEQLTAREREVLMLVARSLSNAEIAEQLVLSEATVKSHVGRVLSKLDLRDRVQIVVFAYESGLVTPAGS